MPRALNHGSVVDGFTLGDKVHEGSMASLWEATHPDHPGPLLMKIPGLYRGEDPAAIVSFEMEQMILPRLTGPHVPRFVASGDFAAEPYLVMERIPGRSLRTRRADYPLPVAEAAAIVAKVADALHALHRQNVVHLDVKPSNVLFRPAPSDGSGAPGPAAPQPGAAGGEAVMIDFGLSHHALLPDLIEEEFRIPYGTAPYMAPEQVLGVRSDRRSDLFALGVMLYRLATGELPFGEQPDMGAVRHRLWRDPAPPRRLRPDIPPWYQEIALRCLEVDPERRHSTAAQLAFDLRHPEQVPLGPRAGRMQRDGLLTVWQRRLAQRRRPPVERRRAVVANEVAAAPIVAVAVDLTEGSPAQTHALRATVGGVLRTLPGARVACINVLRQGLLMGDPTLDEEGRNLHVQRLVGLRQWAEPLKLPPARATFHVLEGSSPAAAILDYAQANNVDHIVMGAREHSLRRAVLGSVAGEVAAQAPCTVTVVRARPRAG